MENQIFIVKASNITNTVEVASYGSETIDGSTSNLSFISNEAYTLQSDGSNWYVIGHVN